jgi:hypothetical protein
MDRERVVQAELIRDVFDNSLLPPRTLPEAVLAWHGGAARRLAGAAYQDRSLPLGTRENGRLAVLADMLEEAGCTDADVLGHLRGPGPHVLGCHALDAVFGKL